MNSYLFNKSVVIAVNHHIEHTRLRHNKVFPKVGVANVFENGDYGTFQFYVQWLILSLFKAQLLSSELGETHLISDSGHCLHELNGLHLEYAIAVELVDLSHN